MEYIRQSTGVSVPVGPFLDISGVTPDPITDLTIAQLGGAGGGGGEVKILQGGSSTVVVPSRLDYAGNGYYFLWLSAATAATVGSGMLTFASTTPDWQPSWKDILILPPVIYDAFIAGTDRFQVDVREIHSGVTVRPATYSGVTFGGVLRAKHVIGGVTLDDATYTGVTVQARSFLKSIDTGTFGGVTIAGVNRVKHVIGGVTIEAGTYGGVTVGGVLRAKHVIGGVTLTDATYTDVTVQARAFVKDIDVGTYGGVSLGGVLRVDDFTATAKGTFGGVTVAGVSKVAGVLPSGVTNIFDGYIEPGKTLRESQRLQNSEAFGISTGGGGSTCAFRDLAGTTNRIKAVTDSNGNRLSVVLDPS